VVRDDPEANVLRVEMVPSQVEWVVFNPAGREVEFAGQRTQRAYDHGVWQPFDFPCQAAPPPNRAGLDHGPQQLRPSLRLAADDSGDRRLPPSSGRISGLACQPYGGTTVRPSAASIDIATFRGVNPTCSFLSSHVSSSTISVFREFVVYSPNDQYWLISHDSWILRLGAEELGRNQGWHASRSTGHPHWKSFYSTDDAPSPCHSMGSPLSRFAPGRGASSARSSTSAAAGCMTPVATATSR
jgi:hypothetical protein